MIHTLVISTQPSKSIKMNFIFGSFFNFKIYFKPKCFRIEVKLNSTFDLVLKELKPNNLSLINLTTQALYFIAKALLLVVFLKIWTSLILQNKTLYYEVTCLFEMWVVGCLDISLHFSTPLRRAMSISKSSYVLFHSHLKLLSHSPLLLLIICFGWSLSIFNRNLVSLIRFYVWNHLI